uniref:Uncharacterized protein n=1 Tax=Glossina morsitans morsitans TaxID=37546 RepID=A0A1B0GAD3_GLOMM
MYRTEVKGENHFYSYVVGRSLRRWSCPPLVAGMRNYDDDDVDVADDDDDHDDDEDDDVKIVNNGSIDQ